MDRTAKSIKFHKSKLEELAGRKQRITILVSAEGRSGGAHDIWAKRLNWVLQDIRKHTVELAKLEKTPEVQIGGKEGMTHE